MTDSTAITLDDAIKRHVAKALLTAGGNMSRAARALGVPQRTFYRMVERFGFREPSRRRPLLVDTVRAYAECPVEIQEVDV